MISKSLLGLFALTAAVAVCAQNKPDDFIEAKLRIVSLEQPILDHGIVNRGKFTPLVIATSSLSQEIDYRGPARLELVTASEDPSAEAKPKGSQATARKATWWIKLPVDKTTHRMILLVGQPAESGGIIAMEDDAKAFTFGSNRYLNFCPYPISVKLPVGVLQIPSQSSKTTKPGAKSGVYYDLVIKTFENGEEKMGYSTRILQNDVLRKIYFIYPAQADTGRVRFKVIDDRPPPKKLPEKMEVPEPKGK
jgi:hypothetical protein